MHSLLALRMKQCSAESIETGRQNQDYYSGGFMPRIDEGLRELEEFQKASWGRVGY